jgi:hypothetical protein
MVKVKKIEFGVEMCGATGRFEKLPLLYSANVRRGRTEYVDSEDKYDIEYFADKLCDVGLTDAEMDEYHFLQGLSCADKSVR